MSQFIVPLIFLFILAYGKYKKVNCYSAFTTGAKKGLKLSFDIFPYVASILIAVALLRVSGITSFIAEITSPIFKVLGVPSEIYELVILKPFTGSGSLAVLADIYEQYGVDSYISRCASVIMGSSETLFYITTVYLTGTNIKRLSYTIPIGLLVGVIGAIIGCLFCKIM